MCIVICVVFVKFPYSNSSPTEKTCGSSNTTSTASLPAVSCLVYFTILPNAPDVLPLIILPGNISTLLSLPWSTAVAPEVNLSLYVLPSTSVGIELYPF